MSALATAQDTAALAIAAYDAAIAAYNAACEPLEPAGDDYDSPEWEAYEERCEALRDEHGLDELRQLRNAAEDLLIGLALDHVSNLAATLRGNELAATLAAGDDIETVRANAWRPSVRKRLISLALRLAA